MKRLLFPALAVLLGLVETRAAFAQTGSKTVRPVTAGKKVALVIGNTEYRNSALPRLAVSANDADDVAASLRNLNFEVKLEHNLSFEQLTLSIRQFASVQAVGADIAMLYYSGHGGQADEENFILPIDYDPPGTDAEVRDRAVSMVTTRNLLEGSGARVRLLVFDACRTSAVSRTKGGAFGLARMTGKPEGTLIAFGSAHGQPSKYDEGARNSYYTREFLDALKKPTDDVESILEQVQRAVYDRSSHQQSPYLYGFLANPLYLGPQPDGNVGRPTAIDPAVRTWELIKDSNQKEEFERFLSTYPNHPLAVVARLRADQLGRPAVAPGMAKILVPTPAPVGPVTPPKPKWQEKINPKDGQKYVYIEPGKFMMGCSPGDKQCKKDETPAHETVVDRGFWIGQTEVTQAAFEKVTGENPINLPEFHGPNLPVVSVPWSRAGKYCQAIGMRLPTEAEWEYAARGGTTEARYGPVASVAITGEDMIGPLKDQHLGPVASKNPNDFGTYDMLGNVWEWTADWYQQGRTRTARGGDLGPFGTRNVRASARKGYDPYSGDLWVGFRCVGDLP